jgi:NAD(P)-dependent dehydrogenase (short-subunit alcohol dehydrogenase family)
MSRVQDRVALVTGDSRGIGTAIAQRLAQEGARVAVLKLEDVGVMAEAALLASSDISGQIAYSGPLLVEHERVVGGTA